MRSIIRYAAGIAMSAAFMIRVAVPVSADVADPAATPVRIEGCSVGEDPARQLPLIGVQPSHASGVTISYVNDTDLTASEIDFRVKYHGKVLTFADRGSIAPHAKVRREFTKISEVFSGNSADCSVAAALFSDGSRWAPPVESPAPSPTPSP